MKTVVNSSAHGPSGRDGWEDERVSNRRRTAADKARPHPPHEHGRAQTRPFGGRARGGARSYAALKRLHAMPRWTVPLATVVLVFVGLAAGRIIGGLCLLAVGAFLGWLAYLAWPELSRGGRTARTLVLGLVTGAALARMLGYWG
jgi:hypothetical protein